MNLLDLGMHSLSSINCDVERLDSFQVFPLGQVKFYSIFQQLAGSLFHVVRTTKSSGGSFYHQNYI